MKMQNVKTSSPPLLSSSGRRLSSAALSDGAERRETAEEGEGKLRQPFYRAAREQAEFLGLNQECEHTALRHSVESNRF